MGDRAAGILLAGMVPVAACCCHPPAGLSPALPLQPCPSGLNPLATPCPALHCLLPPACR